MGARKPYPPPSHWLRRLTFAEAEAETGQRAEELRANVSPAWLERWEAFKALQEPGDQLWYFEHFPQPLTGGAGYCLVRDGESVTFIATVRS